MTHRVVFEGPVDDLSPRRTVPIPISARCTSHYVQVEAEVAGELVTENLLGSRWSVYSTDPTTPGGSAFSSVVGGPHRFTWTPSAVGGRVTIAVGTQGIQ